jgi:hypothetical protein
MIEKAFYNLAIEMYGSNLRAFNVAIDKRAFK